MKPYKASNGRIQMRDSGGKFRKNKLEDFGIFNGNTNATVYICNVCQREFVPLVHTGVCCGVDNKRVKEIVVSKEEEMIQKKIDDIKSKPFINRFDLNEIGSLSIELLKVKYQSNHQINKTMKTLTVKEALEQGFTQYIFSKDGFQRLRDIKHVTVEDLQKEDIVLVEKGPWHPFGISSKDIAELLADHLEEQNVGETSDDTNTVFEAIKELDFTEAENKIAEALLKIDYYKGTDIKLIP